MRDRTFANETTRQGFFRQRAITVLLAAAAAVTTGTPAMASPVTCGMVVTQDVSLDADLTCAGTALVVGADHITIDLRGHTLSGDGGGLGIDNTGGFDHVVIKNGVLHGFASGIAMFDVSYNSLGKLEIRNSGQPGGGGAGYGIVVQLGDHVTISRTYIHDNDFVGIALDESSDNLISENVLSDSQFGSGITIGNNSNNNTVVSNDVFNHTFDEFVAGIVVEGSNNNTIKNNEVSRNSNGIFSAFVPGVGNVIQDNDATDNDIAGILIRAETGQISVVNNRARGNGFFPSPSFPGVDDGIYATGAGVTLTKNDVASNADLGIEGIGVVDGGGNKARDNGNPQQCLGVVCKSPQ